MNIDAIQIHCGIDLQKKQVSEIFNEGGVSIYRLDFAFPDGVEAGGISLSLTFPMLKILQIYSPVSDYSRRRNVVQWFRPTSVHSNFAFGLPSLSTVSDGKYNYVTVAVADAENDTDISFCVQDFKECNEVEFQITLLSGRTKKQEYSTLLRIDEREILLSDTLKEQTEWFLDFYPQTSEIPQASEEPLYSTWYNFHQHPSANALYEELKIARKLGFKSVIIDDGWQYDGNGTSDYIDCGDWAFSKEKFPEPKAFINAVHTLGMKVAFWFPVPFVGFHTQAYQRFKDKLLYEEGILCDGGGATNAGILDVRYKETRDYIVNTVRELMRYGADGIKLDFVDKFEIREETPFANPAMDFQDLNEAVVRLLQELNEAIRSVKSDAMIEFRQNYVGPSITRFCNMLRVADCAFDSITNRIAIADMRMLRYRLAVHSDMLYWAEKETEENVSRQLLNVAFAVPQISVRLKSIPRKHRDIIKSFLTYWTKNRGILLKDKLTAEGIDSTYVALSAENAQKRIAVLYLANDFTYTGKRTDIWNASRAEHIFVDCGDYTVSLRTFDRYGRMISEKISTAIEKVYVPIGGRIECDNENGKITNA